MKADERLLAVSGMSPWLDVRPKTAVLVGTYSSNRYALSFR